MRWWSNRRTRYIAIPVDENDDFEKLHIPWHARSKNRAPRKAILLTLGALVCTILSGVSVLLLLRTKTLPAVYSGCQNPRVRREWRTLSQPEQLDYIDSVKCLQALPSRLTADGSLYDDFPHTHRGIGVTRHEALSFLSWHRYFVAIFESRLRSECNYDGPMPYWNWVLDYEDPASSPVFDNTYGFGGNGDVESGVEGPVGRGYCLKDGPFAGLMARYVEEDLEPHCLSRNFRNTTGPGHFSGHLVRPELIDRMLDEDNILLFVMKLEMGPHNTIPQGIGGDFQSFTAPADPLFFLHHGQLDRLWWIWQNRKPERRTLYSGRNSLESEERASLSDLLEMQGLAADRMVSEVIDTQGGTLCYSYDSM